MNESYEMTFTLKDADMRKLAEIFGDININNCPYFEIQDKYGNSAKYYREKPPSAQPDIAEKLYLYKCYITDKEGLQHEVIHTGDIRRVTGWEI